MTRTTTYSPEQQPKSPVHIRVETVSAAVQHVDDAELFGIHNPSVGQPALGNTVEFKPQLSQASEAPVPDTAPRNTASFPIPAATPASAEPGSYDQDQVRMAEDARMMAQAARQMQPDENLEETSYGIAA